MTVQFINSVPEYRRILRHLRNQSHDVYARYRRQAPAFLTTAAPRSIVVRPGTRVPKAGEAVPGAKPLAFAKKAEELSKLAAQHNEKLEVAQHIYELLRHHYDQQDPTILKLLKLSVALIKQLQAQFTEMLNTLGAAAQKYVPEDFKDLVEYASNQLETRLKGKYRSMTTSFSMAAVIDRTSKMPFVYFVGYIVFDDLENLGVTHDYCIAFSRRSIPGKADQDFVRSLSEYRTPYWVATHDLGQEITTAQEAVNYILLAMHMEKQLDVANPSALPVSKKDIQFDDDKIYTTLLDSKKGRVRLILKPKVTMQEARAVMQKAHIDLKRIVMRAHPRNKDAVQAIGPRLVPYDFKLKNGTTKSVQVHAIDFQFALRDDSSYIFNKDKINEIARIFDLDEDQQVDFVKHFKRYFGMPGAK